MTSRRVAGFLPAALWVAACEPSREAPASTQAPRMPSAAESTGSAGASAPATPKAVTEVPAQQEHTAEATGPDPAPWTIEIADGSGNVTTFRASEEREVTWQYDPVTPAESSSGTYSGGEPAKGSLSAAQVDALWALVRDTKGKESGRGRAMGTMLVQIESASGRRGVVVSSAEARELDEWVRALRR